MTATDLQALLAEGLNLLSANRAFFTKARRTDIASLLPKLQDLATSMLDTAGVPNAAAELQPYFDMARSLLDAENKLAAGLDTQLTGMLTKLQARPVELMILSNIL